MSFDYEKDERDRKIINNILQKDYTKGKTMTIRDLTNKMENWLDTVNYWEDEVRDVAERYDSEYRMYERYNRMIDDIYNTIQKLKKGELNENI